MTTKIRYLGNKPRATCVFCPGVVFAGNGDVQSVPDGAVAEMLKHAHYVLADENGIPAVETEGKPRDNDIDDIEESDKPPMVNLETMSETELREYAQRYFDHAFHHKAGAVKMRETIVGLMNRG